MIHQILSIQLEFAIHAGAFWTHKRGATPEKWISLTMNLFKIKTRSKWPWLMMLRNPSVHVKFATLQSSMVRVSWSTTSSQNWRNVTFVAVRLLVGPTILPQIAASWSCKTSQRGKKRLWPMNSSNPGRLHPWSWVAAMEGTSCRWLLDPKVVLLSVSCVHALLA